MNIVTIVQARVHSTRLPRKVLAKIGNMTCLEHVLKRCKMGRYPVVLAIPWTQENGPLDEIGMELGCGIFVGPESHVLARYYQTARFNRAEAIIRITADCPFVNPNHIKAVGLHLQYDKADFVSNVFPIRTFPRGYDVEGFSMAALENAIENHDPLNYEHEHVTRFMQRTYKPITITQSNDLSGWRMTLDTQEDLDWFQDVASKMSVSPPHPTLEELCQAIAEKKIDVLSDRT